METGFLAVLCLTAIYVLFRLMAAPIRLLWKAILNTICGFIMIVIVNILGKGIGLALGMNLVNILGIAILGLPGAALLLVLHALVA